MARTAAAVLCRVLWWTGRPTGAAGVTAGVQTPVTLVVGAEKATLTRRTLSGSTPVGDSHVGCGVTRIPQRRSATRRTLLHRRAMQ